MSVDTSHIEKSSSVGNELEVAVKIASNKKVDELVKDFESKNWIIKEAAYSILARYVRESSGTDILERVKKLANMKDPQVARYVGRLSIDQATKDELQEKRKRIEEIIRIVAALEDRKKQWREFQENAEPSKDEGRWVISNIDNIAVHINQLESRIKDLNMEKKGLEKIIESEKLLRQ